MRNTAFLILLIPLLLQCGGRAEDPSVLRIASRSTVNSLDPYNENSVVSFSVYSNVFETLVSRDSSLRIIPCLASEWHNPDDLTWIFSLRKNVRFHNGAILTAEDARASIERARNNSKISNSLWMIDHVEVLNPTELKITTLRCFSSLANRLAEVFILPSTDVSPSQSRSRVPSGTGPYRIRDWKPGDFVHLGRNPDYWGGVPAIPDVTFVAVPDLQKRLDGLKNGKYDVLPQLEPSVVSDPSVARNQKIRIFTTQGVGVIYLGMDLQRERSPYVDVEPNPFRDLRVRKALFHALNVNHIVNNILEHRAEPATEMVAPMIFGFNPDLSRPPYDPEIARRLLQEAGYGNGFKVRFDYSKDRYRNDREIGESVAADLENVGIRVEKNPLPRQSLFATINASDTSLFMVGWFLSSGDASSFFDYLVHTPDEKKNYGRENSGGYSNPELDRMIESSAGIMNPSERSQILRQMMALTMKDLPYIPLHIENNFCASTTRVKWQPRPDEYIYVKDIHW